MHNDIEVRPVSEYRTGQVDVVECRQQRVLEKELPKELILYVPENIDIDRILEENPPKHRRIHRDNLLYILHLIYSIRQNRADLEFEQYTPIHSVLLKRRVREYRLHLDYLLESGVILESRQYIVGQKSRSFCYREIKPFSPTKLKEVIITKKTLIKSIRRYIDIGEGEMITEINMKGEDEYDYLFQWFNENLSIDYERANDYLDYMFEAESKNPEISNPGDRLRARSIPVFKFNRGDFSPIIDKTAGRLHSVFTQLKTELRQFVKYEGKELASIDVVNSQPYLFSILLDENTFQENNILSKLRHYNPAYKNKQLQHKMLHYVSQIERDRNWNAEVSKYKMLVSSGQFYEHFGEILIESGILEIQESETKRGLAKKATFSSLFSPNSSIGYNQTMKAFKKTFPRIFKLFELIKFGKGNHPALSILLQKIEAEIILDKVCRLITDFHPEIPIFTLHDSVITTAENVDIVESVMYSILSESVGVLPTFKKEYWSSGGN